jgi:hypothetical protein
VILQTRVFEEGTSMRTTIDEAKLDAFLGRAVTDLAAAESSVASYIGDRLGLYRAMATG